MNVPSPKPQMTPADHVAKKLIEFIKDKNLVARVGAHIVVHGLLMVACDSFKANTDDVPGDAEEKRQFFLEMVEHIYNRNTAKH